MSAPKILVPVDGSPASLRAIDFAIEMVSQSPGHFAGAAPRGKYSSIELAGGEKATEWLQEAASHASTKALKDAIGKCEGASVTFKTLTRTGQTAQTIALVAHKEDVKHIVMGTRGLGSIKGLLLGSVATQVVHLAEVPITLIK